MYVRTIVKQKTAKSKLSNDVIDVYLYHYY